MFYLCAKYSMLIDSACREQEVKQVFFTMLLRAKETGP